MTWEFSKDVFWLLLILITWHFPSLTRGFSSDNRKNYANGKNKLQDENFHEPNRWKPPVRLKPFDPKLFDRFHLKGGDAPSEPDRGSGVGPAVFCDDEDGDCGEVAEISGNGMVPDATENPTTVFTSQGKFGLTKTTFTDAKRPFKKSVEQGSSTKEGAFSTTLPLRSTENVTTSATSASTNVSTPGSANTELTTKIYSTNVTKIPSRNIPSTSNFTRIEQGFGVTSTSRQTKKLLTILALQPTRSSSTRKIKASSQLTTSESNWTTEASASSMRPSSSLSSNRPEMSKTIGDKLYETKKEITNVPIGGNDTKNITCESNGTIIAKRESSRKAIRNAWNGTATIKLKHLFKNQSRPMENDLSPSYDFTYGKNETTTNASIEIASGKVQTDVPLVGFNQSSAITTSRHTASVITSNMSVIADKREATTEVTTESKRQPSTFSLSTISKSWQNVSTIYSEDRKASTNSLYTHDASTATYSQGLENSNKLMTTESTVRQTTNMKTRLVYTTLKPGIGKTKEAFKMTSVSSASAPKVTTVLPDVSENSVEVPRDSICQKVKCKSGGICKEIGLNKGKCLCPLGTGGEFCERESSFTHPKFRGSSFLMFSKFGKQGKNFRLSLEFRADTLNGILIFAGNPQGFSEKFLALLLIDGFVQLRTDCGSGFMAITSSKRVSLSAWHRITIRKFAQQFLLQHDDSPLVSTGIRCLQRNIQYEKIYLGGIEDRHLQLTNIGLMPGFIGCIREFTLAGKHYIHENKNMSHVGGFDIDDCSSGSCLRKKCLNKGICIPHVGNSTKCVCPLGYSDTYCSKVVNVTMPKFNGSGYMQFEGLGASAWSKLDIEIIIKPESRSGLILYNGDKTDGHGDFVLLALRNGSVELRFDCGSGVAIIRSRRQLVMGKWYHIRVNRRGNIGNLTIDVDDPVTGNSKGPFQMLKLREPLYIGGTNSFSSIPLAAEVHTHFQGCIEMLKINNHKVIWKDAVYGRDVSNCESHECQINTCSQHGSCESYKGESWCHCYLGYSGRMCEKGTDITIPKFNGHSFLKFQEKDLFRHMSLPTSVFSIEFKSNVSNGLILWNGQKSANLRWKGDYISLSLIGGFIVCRYNLGSGDVILKSMQRLDDNMWHKVWIYRHDGKGEMQIDDTFVTKAEAKGNYIMLNTNGELYIGGAENIFSTTGSRHLHGFNGCIRNTRIGARNIDMINDASSGHHVEQC